MNLRKKTDLKENKEFWDGVQRASDFIDSLPEWQQRVWGFSKDSEKKKSLLRYQKRIMEDERDNNGSGT